MINKVEKLVPNLNDKVDMRYDKVDMRHVVRHKALRLYESLSQRTKRFMEESVPVKNLG